MSLREVLNLVEAQFEGSDPSVTFAMGMTEVARHGEPPRIVWVPISAKHSGVDRPGGNPRPVRKRSITVVAHIWGGDYDETEALLNALVLALHKTLSGSYQTDEEQWPTEVTAMDGAQGALCLLRFTVDVGVYDVPRQKKTVESVEIVTATGAAGAVSGDGKLDSDD